MKKNGEQPSYRLPKKLEPTVMNLMQEAGVMMLPEQQALEYIKNVTGYKISISFFYKLKKKIAIDDTLWILNFSKGGFLHDFRKRMFIFENTLKKVIQQYNIELARDREDQDTSYLKTLVDQIINLNTKIAQFAMSSPMMAAIKMANDPDFKDLDAILDENEKKQFLIEFGKKFGIVSGREMGNNNDHGNTKSKKILIDKYNEKVGSEIAEGQGIRIKRVLPESSESENDGSVTGSSDNGQDSGTEGKAEEDTREDPEEVYRRQKERGIFFNPE